MPTRGWFFLALLVGIAVWATLDLQASIQFQGGFVAGVVCALAAVWGSRNL